MKYEGLGWCWMIGRCDWWNPPFWLLDLALGTGLNFCMKCWEMK
jgi:hypothetical protein